MPLTSENDGCASVKPTHRHAIFGGNPLSQLAPGQLAVGFAPTDHHIPIGRQLAATSQIGLAVQVPATLSAPNPAPDGPQPPRFFTFGALLNAASHPLQSPNKD